MLKGQRVLLHSQAQDRLSLGLNSLGLWMRCLKPNSKIHAVKKQSAFESSFLVKPSRQISLEYKYVIIL
jgi:hypothetical protein